MPEELTVDKFLNDIRELAKEAHDWIYDGSKEKPYLDTPLYAIHCLRSSLEYGKKIEVILNEMLEAMRRQEKEHGGDRKEGQDAGPGN